MSRAFPELFILRHGQTEWNASGRMQGSLDSPLTALGRTQAAHQGAMLARLGTSKLAHFASPIGRVVETARIALNLQGDTAPVPKFDPRLREISMGLWEGLDRAQIRAGWPGVLEAQEAWGIYDAAPQGEGLMAVRTRLTAFLDALTEPAVIFTHGLASMVLRTVVLGLPLDAFHTLPGGQGNIHHIKDGHQAMIDS